MSCFGRRKRKSVEGWHKSVVPKTCLKSEVWTESVKGSGRADLEGTAVSEISTTDTFWDSILSNVSRTKPQKQVSGGLNRLFPGYMRSKQRPPKKGGWT